MSAAPLLQLEDVAVHFPIGGGLVRRRAGVVRAVDGVSLSVRRGEVVGLVGESGCGKSTLARGIVRLAPITRGNIVFEGKDLAAMNRRELRAMRPQLQMIFQDPYASLNPRMTVLDALEEPIRVHGLAPKSEIRARVRALMERVGLAAAWMRKYPHEFSGGQRQRIAIARALALKPKLIIADEPVSALDVSVQAQILNLMDALSRVEDLAMLLISHDLGVVKHLSRRIAVMYLGKIVELGDAEQVYNAPRHPYTQALISAIPVPNPRMKRSRASLLLRGDPPSPVEPPSGCTFHPRCPYAQPACAQAGMGLLERQPGHWSACIRDADVQPPR